MAMIHQISLLPLFFLLLFTPSFIYADVHQKPVVMPYHDGPVISDSLNVVLIWYGRCGRIQKNTIRSFLKSLNYASMNGPHPLVSSWWSVIESYQTAVPGARGLAPRRPRIPVNVVKQITDVSYKFGKILTSVDVIPQMAHDATNGDTHLFPIIVTARDVTIQGLCTGKCADHGVFDDNRPYIVVGNPETECPGACAWPFHELDIGQKGPILLPPNGNMAADAMVSALATALADTVASPQNSGFFDGLSVNPIGPGSVCSGIYGAGASPGNAGNVLTDPISGAAYNANGNKGKKFLLPAIWIPKTSSCWTLT